MSNTVTLNANAVSTQQSQATVTVTDNGVTITPAITWATNDATVASVNVGGFPGLVEGHADPSGTGSKTATITAFCTVNGNSYSVSGIVTVVTTGDTIVMTLDFGAPFTP